MTDDIVKKRGKKARKRLRQAEAALESLYDAYDRRVWLASRADLATALACVNEAEKLLKKAKEREG